MRDCPTNLCDTAERRVFYRTMPCLPRPRSDGCAMPLDPDYAHVRRHEWSDGNRGYDGGVCLHCHRILSEVRLRVNPQTMSTIPNRRHPHTAFARLVAMTAADVPPVQFIHSEAA